MQYWTGTLYTSDTLTENGNSGWIQVPTGEASHTAIVGLGNGMTRALLRFVGASMTVDETNDIDVHVAWDTSGTGDVKVCDVPQIAHDNLSETTFLPGGPGFVDGEIAYEGGTNASVLTAPIPPYWKLVWTLGGTSKSMTFTCYATIEW